MLLCSWVAVVMAVTCSPAAALCWAIRANASATLALRARPSCISALPCSMVLMALAVSCWMLPIMLEISVVASRVRPARLRTSSATTAKPRPCSPARAASMAALRASRLVWSAMAVMTPTMPPISWERWPRVLITSAVPLSALAICSRAVDASSIATWPMRVCWALSLARRSVARMLSAMFSEVALNSSTAPAMLLISPDCCSMPSWAPLARPESTWERLLTC